MRSAAASTSAVPAASTTFTASASVSATSTAAAAATTSTSTTTRGSGRGGCGLDQAQRLFCSLELAAQCVGHRHVRLGRRRERRDTVGRVAAQGALQPLGIERLAGGADDGLPRGLVRLQAMRGCELHQPFGALEISHIEATSEHGVDRADREWRRLGEQLVQVRPRGAHVERVDAAFDCRGVGDCRHRHAVAPHLCHERLAPLNDAAAGERVEEDAERVLVGSKWRLQAAQRVEGLLHALELSEACVASHESVEELEVASAPCLG